MGPREKLQHLDRIAQFAEKEQIRVLTVMDGKPLRESAHGESYRGLATYYAENSSEVADLSLKLLKDNVRRHPVTVITSDARVEERARVLGGAVMRSSTFRKAVAGVIGGGGGGGGGGMDRGPRSDGRRRNRRRRRDGDRGGAPREQAGEQRQNQGGSDDPVKNLLDVVE